MTGPPGLSGELHECNNKEIDISSAILVSLDAEIADLNITLGAGCVLCEYSLPFKSLCYSIAYSYLVITPISV